MTVLIPGSAEETVVGATTLVPPVPKTPGAAESPYASEDASKHSDMGAIEAAIKDLQRANAKLKSKVGWQ